MRGYIYNKLSGNLSPRSNNLEENTNSKETYFQTMVHSKVLSISSICFYNEKRETWVDSIAQEVTPGGIIDHLIKTISRDIFQ
ncbi:MAG TPA: hypothetical protein DCS93_11775 [Microscillaceae bacterium]|nr:hypothetical protein [Microscillaceae bacterium]